MKNKYKFSILIPAYKAQFLGEAIESVLSQTYDNYEIIIVNDASPEDLGAIVSQFTDDKIKYSVNEKNCGAINVVDNWNICLEKASGDFVICMGDDDKLLPNCLQAYSDLIDKYPNLDVYHGWSQIINEESEISDLQEPRPEFENIYSFMYHNFLKGRRQFIGDYAFRRSHLIDCGGFFKIEYGFCSDDLSCFRAIANKGIANTQEYVFQYRENSRTITNNIPIEFIWKTRSYKIQWAKEYLNNSAPSSKLDVFLKEKLLNTVDYKEYRREILEIQWDVTNKGLKRAFHWIKKRNRNNLPLYSVVYNSLLGLTQRLRR